MAGAVIEITTTSATPAELEVAALLRGLLEEHDLGRWAFTDRVRVQAMVVPRSHPVLLLNTRHREADRLLSTYLHEQLHWWLDGRPGVEAAMAEVAARWPEAPGHADGGARDAFSTWLHLVLCPLELAAVEAVLPADRAAAVFEALDVYRWVYDEIAADRPWFDDLLVRHDLVPPAGPATPTRWEPASEVGGAMLYPAGEHPDREAAAVAALVAAHERFPALDELLGERDVMVDVEHPTGLGIGIGLGDDLVEDLDVLAVVYGYSQAVTRCLGGPAYHPALLAVPDGLVEALGGGRIGRSTAIGGALLLRALGEPAVAAIGRVPFLAGRLAPVVAHLDELLALVDAPSAA